MPEKLESGTRYCRVPCYNAQRSDSGARTLQQLIDLRCPHQEKSVASGIMGKEQVNLRGPRLQVAIFEPPSEGI